MPNKKFRSPESEENIVVLFQGTIYVHGYGPVAQMVMRDKRLHPSSKAIYAYLCSFAGASVEEMRLDRKAWPSLKTMLDELQMSENTFYKHRKALIDLGYLDVVQEGGQGEAFGRNIYSIIAVLPESDDPAPNPRSANFAERKNCGSARSSIPAERKICGPNSISTSITRNNKDQYKQQQQTIETPVVVVDEMVSRISIILGVSVSTKTLEGLLEQADLDTIERNALYVATEQQYKLSKGLRPFADVLSSFVSATKADWEMANHDIHEQHQSELEAQQKQQDPPTKVNIVRGKSTNPQKQRDERYTAFYDLYPDL